LFSQRQDHALSDLLPRKQWGERNLVMINLRTAHSPYDHNYENHDEPIARWPTDGPLSRDMREGNAYDNAVRYFDDVVADIVAQFDQLEGERYLLITGDHGQLLGENEVWGHNRLLPPVVDVPVMVLARDAPQGALDDLAGQRWVSHYEAGLWLAQRLGARVLNPNADPNVHFVKGKLLLGDNSIMQVKESGDDLQFSEPMLLSKWLQGPAQRTLPAPDQPADPG
ncbi:sulfatase-like hydrolase/transferase, partial [Pseudomonas abyssi]|uniref:sulfatase-like hydrolase/transferase n=1 Tax=Pseudomonas abyssi TaxID=170540 RepID=UPI003C7ABF21